VRNSARKIVMFLMCVRLDDAAKALTSDCSNELEPPLTVNTGDKVLGALSVV